MHRDEQRLTLQVSPPSAVGYGSVSLVATSARGHGAVVFGARRLGALALAGLLWSAPGVALAQEEAAASEESAPSEEAPSAPPSEVTTKIEAAKAQIGQLDFT